MNSVKLGQDMQYRFPVREIDNNESVREDPYKFTTLQKSLRKNCEHLKKVSSHFVSKEDLCKIDFFMSKLTMDLIITKYHAYSQRDKHLTYLVGVLEDNKDSKSSQLNKDFLSNGLHEVLEDFNVNADNDDIELRNFCFKIELAYENKAFSSHLASIRKERYEKLVDAFTFTMQAGEKNDRSMEGYSPYFNAVSNLGCAKFGFPFIKDAYALAPIDKRIEELFFKEVELSVNQFAIFRELAEQYSKILKDIFAKHHITELDNIRPESLSFDVVEEIDAKVFTSLNLLIESEECITLNNLFKQKGKEGYDFSHHIDRLHSWLVNQYFCNMSHKTHLTVIQLEGGDSADIYSHHDAFFGVEKKMALHRLANTQGKNSTTDIFIPLQLTHLMKLDFSKFRPLVTHGLLIQALSNTHQAQEIVVFTLNPHVMRQLDKLPDLVFKSFCDELIEKMAKDELLKEQMFYGMSEYELKDCFEKKKKHCLLKRINSCAYLQGNTPKILNNLFSWIKKEDLFDEFIQNFTGLKVDIGLIIKKYFGVEFFEKYPLDKLRVMLTKNSCLDLIDLALKTKKCEAAFKLLQTGLCDDLIFRKLNDFFGNPLLIFIDANFAKGVHFIAGKGFLEDKSKKHLCERALFAACKTDSLSCFYGLLKSEQIINTLKNSKIKKKLGNVVYKLKQNDFKKIFKERINHPYVENVYIKIDGGKEYTELDHLVCLNAYKEIESLVTLTDVDANNLGSLGTAALHRACCLNRIKCVVGLLKSKTIDINIEDYLGITPLEIAAEQGNIEIVKILLTNTNIKINKALSKACIYGHEEIVRMLLEFGCNNINEQFECRRTALLDAMRKRNPEIIKMLLAQPNIDVNIPDHNKRTALDEAEEYGNMEIIEMLLMAGGKKVSHGTHENVN